MSSLIARAGTLPAVVRYVIVGGLSFAVDFTVFITAYRFTGLGAAGSAALGYSSAFILNFGMNRSWVFVAMGGRVGRQFLRYLTLVGANLLITAIGVGTLVARGVDYRISRICVAAIVVLINFVIMRLWVFRRSAA